MRFGSKYRNKKVDFNGYTFDSQAEARRYKELVILQGISKIEKLTVHPTYDLTVMGVHICKYEADFSYHDETGFVVEDVKGVRTSQYRLKRKLMKAIYGIDIKEVEA